MKANTSELVEKSSFENTNDALREIDELVQDCRDRLTFGAFDIRERYAEGNLQIVLKLSLRRECEDVYAFIQRAEGFGVHLDRVITRKFPVPSPKIGGTKGQSLVFVTHVQFTEKVKEGIPSTVRFESVNEPLGGWGELLYFLGGGDCKTLCVRIEGKGNVFERFSISNRKTARKVIKRCSEIVDSIPHNKGDFDRHRIRDFGNRYALPFLIRMRAENQIAGYRACIVGNTGIRLLDERFGPFNLQLRAVKRIIGHE